MVSNSWREVTHLWYLGWPEKGVPSEANSIIAFLIEARSYIKSLSSNDSNKVSFKNNFYLVVMDVFKFRPFVDVGTSR